MSHFSTANRLTPLLTTLALLSSCTEDSPGGLTEAAPKWVLGVGIGAAILVVILVGHLANKAIKKVTSAVAEPAQSQTTPE